MMFISIHYHLHKRLPVSLQNNLRSKRFRLVSEQRKTEERDSQFWPREK